MACCELESCAARAVPEKLPRTLMGMAMSFSACLTRRCPSASVTPSARLKDTVLASSVSSWLMELGTARSATRAKADSGTIAVVFDAMACPAEEVRDAGLAEVTVEVPVLASVLAWMLLTVVAPVAALVLVLSVEGTYRSFSTMGDSWKRGDHSMITEYWFRSL